MQFRKQLFSWFLCTFCFCLTFGALNTSAHAASVNCGACGADLGSCVFVSGSGCYHYCCSACGKWNCVVFGTNLIRISYGTVEFVTVSPPTCTSSGRGYYICSPHGRGSIETYGSPLEHNYEETSRTEPATTRPGSIQYTCSQCGETKTESIPALPPAPPDPDSISFINWLGSVVGLFNMTVNSIMGFPALRLFAGVLVFLMMFGLLARLLKQGRKGRL